MKRSEFLSDIKKLPIQELRARARGLAEELMKIRFRKGASQLEQTHHIGVLKKNLARVQTLISHKAAEGTGKASA